MESANPHQPMPVQVPPAARLDFHELAGPSRHWLRMSLRPLVLADWGESCVNSARAALNLRRSAQSLNAAGVVGDDVQMGRRIDASLDLDAAVVAATHRNRRCFSAVVDEAEA